MPPPVQDAVAGLVLAGGRSSRMGRDKIFAPLGGRPLVAHAIARLRPQVGPLALSANGDPEAYRGFAASLLSDEAGAQLGPLSGIYVGLQFAALRGCALLAVVPGDAPFFPLDLVARLRSQRSGEEIAAVQSVRGLEPLFSLWPTGAVKTVGTVLRQGRSGVAEAIRSLPHAVVLFEDSSPDPFMNVNNPDDLMRAELALTSMTSFRHT